MDNKMNWSLLRNGREGRPAPKDYFPLALHFVGPALHSIVSALPLEPKLTVVLILGTVHPCTMTKNSVAPLTGKANGFCDIDGLEDNDAEPKADRHLVHVYQDFVLKQFLTKPSGLSRQKFLFFPSRI